MHLAKSRPVSVHYYFMPKTQQTPIQVFEVPSLHSFSLTGILPHNFNCFRSPEHWFLSTQFSETRKWEVMPGCVPSQGYSPGFPSLISNMWLCGQTNLVLNPSLPLLAVWPWTSSIIFLSFRLPSVKMKIILGNYVRRLCWEDWTRWSAVCTVPA